MPRNWTLWDLQLISVGLANGLSYREMAPGFGVSRCAVLGAFHRGCPGERPPRPPREPALLVRQINITLDEDMFARIVALKPAGQTRAAFGRDLLEWGLEALENER